MIIPPNVKDERPAITRLYLYRLRSRDRLSGRQRFFPKSVRNIRPASPVQKIVKLADFPFLIKGSTAG